MSGEHLGGIGDTDLGSKAKKAPRQYAMGCDTLSQFCKVQPCGAEGASWQREALPAAEGGAKRRPDRPSARAALRADVTAKNVSSRSTNSESTFRERLLEGRRHLRGGVPTHEKYLQEGLAKQQCQKVAPGRHPKKHFGRFINSNTFLQLSLACPAAHEGGNSM